MITRSLSRRNDLSLGGGWWRRSSYMEGICEYMKLRFVYSRQGVSLDQGLKTFNLKCRDTYDKE
jgi:hypothetical protein